MKSMYNCSEIKRYQNVINRGSNPIALVYTVTVLWENSLSICHLCFSISSLFLSISFCLHPEISQYGLVVATSGDTGGAALHAFGHNSTYPVTVFYPASGVSRSQALQMAQAASQRRGLQSVGVNGADFDFCQSAVKAMLSDKEFAGKIQSTGVHLTGANSINWGRLVPQVRDELSFCALIWGVMVSFWYQAFSFVRSHLKSSHIADKRKNFHMALYPLPPSSNESVIDNESNVWQMAMHIILVLPHNLPKQCRLSLTGTLPWRFSVHCEMSKETIPNSRRKIRFLLLFFFFCALKSERPV